MQDGDKAEEWRSRSWKRAEEMEGDDFLHPALDPELF